MGAGDPSVRFSRPVLGELLNDEAGDLSGGSVRVEDRSEARAVRAVKTRARSVADLGHRARRRSKGTTGHIGRCARVDGRIAERYADRRRQVERADRHRKGSGVVDNGIAAAGNGPARGSRRRKRHRVQCRQVRFERCATGVHVAGLRSVERKRVAELRIEQRDILNAAESARICTSGRAAAQSE